MERDPPPSYNSVITGQQPGSRVLLSSATSVSDQEEHKNDTASISGNEDNTSQLRNRITTNVSDQRSANTNSASGSGTATTKNPNHNNQASDKCTGGCRSTREANTSSNDSQEPQAQQRSGDIWDRVKRGFSNLALFVIQVLD